MQISVILTNFKDFSRIAREYRSYVLEACRLGLMGRRADKSGLIENFNPRGQVIRSEFAAVLSRYLYGTRYDGDMSAQWYMPHMRALADRDIMKIISNPQQKELRGFVMIMLYRIASL